jgi:sulfite exporter TauE/SafE/copper chaperone CopZ
MSKNKNLKEHTYQVEGMHCPSCELAIEKRILKEEGVMFADASTAKGEVYIKYKDKRPTLKELNKIFDEEGYRFCKIEEDEESGLGTIRVSKRKLKEYLLAFLVAGVVILIYSQLQKAGVTSALSVNENSTLGLFFLFGLVAGLSSCAALVGGLILSMSKQWTETYEKQKNKTKDGKPLAPHLLFNIGRLISFALFGAILGGLGSFFSISLQASAILAILVAVIMLILGLQMLEVPFFKKIRIGLPKFISRWALKKEEIRSPMGPFILGAVTFFLPCGFTITAQSLALVSGSALRGALITTFFALGTLPILLIIGATSKKLTSKQQFADKFLKIAGVLVVIFSIYTFNSQLNLLGVRSLSDITISNSNKKEKSTEDDLPKIEDGYQVIEMSASSYGYSPEYFKVRAGVPVKWIITNNGVSGCTDAIISQGLFSGEIPINQKVVVKEFTPEKAGRYKFSCWMGMVTGVIEVVNET